jgi:hypothetical protein
VNLNTQTLEKEILPKKIKNWLNFSKVVADDAIYARTYENATACRHVSAVQVSDTTRLRK